MEEGKEPSPRSIGKPTPKGISRRQFLIGLGATAFSAPFILEGVKNALIEGVSRALVSEGLSKQVNNNVSKALEQFSKEENPDHRPMMSLISDSVDSYQLQSGRKAFYQRDPSFKPNEHYKGMLDELKSKPFYKMRSNDFAGAVIKSFDRRQQAVYESSFNFFLGLQSAACPGSGYYHRLRDEFGDSLDANLREVTDVGKYKAIEGFIFQDMSSTRRYIEGLVSQEQKPVSSSKILEHFLSKNEGNVAESLLDTAVFLKFMARNDIDRKGKFVGDNPESVANIDWMKKNIRDEFSGPAYTQLEESNPSMLNLIGKPYHSWFLVSLLQFFPESVIQAGCYYELFKHVDEHGLGKIKADISTLSELNGIEKFLNSHTLG